MTNLKRIALVLLSLVTPRFIYRGPKPLRAFAGWLAPYWYGLAVDLHKTSILDERDEGAA